MVTIISNNNGNKYLEYLWLWIVRIIMVTNTQNNNGNGNLEKNMVTNIVVTNI